MKISLAVLKLQSGQDFQLITSKGHDSAKKVSGVIVLFLGTPSDGDFVCTKFYENVLEGIKDIERTPIY